MALRASVEAFVLELAQAFENMGDRIITADYDLVRVVTNVTTIPDQVLRRFGTGQKATLDIAQLTATINNTIMPQVIGLTGIQVAALIRSKL